MIYVEAVVSAGRSPPGYRIEEPVGIVDVFAGHAEDGPPPGQDLLGRGDHVTAALCWYLAQRSGRKRSREADGALQSPDGGPPTKQPAIPMGGCAAGGRSRSDLLKDPGALPGEVSEAPADLPGGHPL